MTSSAVEEALNCTEHLGQPNSVVHGRVLHIFGLEALVVVDYVRPKLFPGPVEGPFIQILQGLLDIRQAAGNCVVAPVGFEAEFLLLVVDVRDETLHGGASVQGLERPDDALVHGLNKGCGVRGKEVHSDPVDVEFRRVTTSTVHQEEDLEGEVLLCEVQLHLGDETVVKPLKCQRLRHPSLSIRHPVNRSSALFLFLRVRGYRDLLIRPGAIICPAAFPHIRRVSLSLWGLNPVLLVSSWKRKVRDGICFQNIAISSMLNTCSGM